MCLVIDLLSGFVTKCLENEQNLHLIVQIFLFFFVRLLSHLKKIKQSKKKQQKNPKQNKQNLVLI